MKFEENGEERSVKRMCHFDIKHFYVFDRVKRGEMFISFYWPTWTCFVI